MDERARARSANVAETLLKKNAFARDDYKEMLQLTYFYLGGKVNNFTLQLPGPDHHARWMAKGLYNIIFIKMGNSNWICGLFKLVQRTFRVMSSETGFPTPLSALQLYFEE